VRTAPLPAQLLYGRLLATTVQHLLVGGPPPLARLRLVDGRTEPLPLERWLGPIDAADAAVLDRATPLVLDIGCGPGRHSAALRAAGKPALGVDLSPVAVRLARGRGAAAIARSVFADVPGTGEWRTALLLDGNIGIGGDPAGLLRRVATLLAPHGAALVELGAPGSGTYRTRVRLEAPGAVSEWFGWARVAIDGIDRIAADAGLAVGEAVAVEGRWFASLEPAAKSDGPSHHTASLRAPSPGLP
jgi:SAM-dependent methyltransferase